MALRTNKLDVFVDCKALDDRCDIFEVTKGGDEKLSWSSRVFEPFGEPYILSIVGQGGSKPFYILAPKGVVTVKQLRTHFEESYGGTIADESLESADIGKSLLPKKVSSVNVPQHVRIQLLMNALYASNKGGGASLQNVTGHLYCFNTGKNWVKKTKDGRHYQIIGLEFRVTDEMLLKVNVRTFTRANASGLKFDKKKKSEYPRYIVDYVGPTMRRVAPGERPNANDIYIQKQYEGAKSHIPFLEFKSRLAFANSKCGVIQEVLARFNSSYAGIAHIAFAEVDESKRLPSPKKLLNADYPAWFTRSEYVVVDVVQSSESKVACEYVADWLALGDFLGKRPRIVDEVVPEANNVLVIHDREYYKDSGIEDPHQSSIASGAVCQHVTIETIQQEQGAEIGQGNLRYVFRKCLVEAEIKRDVFAGIMGLYDWKALGLDSSLTFAISEPDTDEEGKSRERGKAPKRYSFLDVAPNGSLAFHRGSIDDVASDSRWDELAYDLAGEWSFQTEGFIIDADNRIDIIERTDGFPVPELDDVKKAVESVDWYLSKREALAVVSIVTGDPDLDRALKDLCIRVSETNDTRVRSNKLNSLIKETAKLCAGTYTAQQIRSLLNERIENMFARRLLTSVPRDAKAKKNVYEPLIGIHCVKEGDNLLYWANNFQGLGQNGRNRGCVIRRVRNVDGDEPFSEGLIETLAAPIARLNDVSVLPLPLKYLREWVRATEDGRRG